MLKSLLPRLHIRLLILILVSVMPAFAIIVYSGIEQRQQATAAAEQQALAIVRGITARQHDLIRQSHELLGKLARDPALHRAIQLRACGKPLAEQRSLYAHYIDFFAADTRGDIVCSASPEGIGININDRAYFRRAVESRDFAVGDYQISRITGKSTIILAHPVLDEGGQIDAVLAVGVDLRWLSDLIAGAALPAGSILTLVDGEGTILARTPDPEGWVGRTISDRQAFQKIFSGPGRAPSIRYGSTACAGSRTWRRSTAPTRAASTSGSAFRTMRCSATSRTPSCATCCSCCAPPFSFSPSAGWPATIWCCAACAI